MRERALPKIFFQHIEAATVSHGLKLVPTDAFGPTLDATIAQFAAEPNVVCRDAELHHRNPFALGSSRRLRSIACRLFTAFGSSQRKAPDFLWNRYRAVFRNRPRPYIEPYP